MKLYTFHAYNYSKKKKKMEDKTWLGKMYRSIKR